MAQSPLSTFAQERSPPSNDERLRRCRLDDKILLHRSNMTTGRRLRGKRRRRRNTGRGATGGHLAGILTTVAAVLASNFRGDAPSTASAVDSVAGSTSMALPPLSSAIEPGAMTVDDPTPGLLFASDAVSGNPSSSADPFANTQRWTLSPGNGHDGGGVRGLSSPSPETWERKRMHPIRRKYAPENARVRREVDAIENSIPRSLTGLRGDVNHVVHYLNHPFDRMREERERLHNHSVEGGQRYPEEAELDSRNLQGDVGSEDEGSSFNPIRIHFDTSALDGQRTSENGARIDFVKNKILPRMRDFWSSALSVVPVEGNLLISTAELAGRLYCGDSEFAKVPASHLSTGVSNADMVLYVSGAPSTRFCGPSTLAVAVACNFDQFDRPTAGAVNFCLDQIEVDAGGEASDSVIEDNVDVAIHEAAHVLGMSSNSYRFFWDPDSGTERTPRPFSAKSVICVDGIERTLILPADNTMKFFIATNGQRYASIVTDKVATVARNQFDCLDLTGGQLENQPTGDQSCTGDHWDERMFYPEALSGVISPTTNILSPLTLALLEDSGWYRANYTKANVSPWGHGSGCNFVDRPCLVGGGNGRDGEVPTYSKGYFCNKASARGCSPSHTHKMACTVIDYGLRGTNLPPSQFQYFGDPALGGPREADYCPVYGSVYSGLKAEGLDCRISANQETVDLIYSEEYRDNSMCFETTSGEGRCYNSRCIYDDFNLQVEVDGKWYTCNKDFEQIDVSTLSGAFGTTVTCPRLASACPDMFCPVNCAGRGVCEFDHRVNGTEPPRPRCRCFDESDTSAGCSETFVLDGKYLRDAGSLSDKLNANFLQPLVAVFVDHPDTWTKGSWVWAAALFVVFLLMILCICSSFWQPEREKKRSQRKRAI